MILKVAPELHIEGWVHSATAGIPEAWIFCHGYNTTLIQSLQILGQMASFGNFPNYIKPFIFTWPAGKNFLQFYPAFYNSCNAEIHKNFHHFLLSLRDNGIRQFHIMVHSMGSRMFLMSMRKIVEDSSLFATVKKDVPSTDRVHQIELVTLTFLNPEYYLKDFVEKVKNL
ncbi:hypothetical protein IE077_000529 [Cardiosporidium cionae]|uniref:Alpha/beta hydrolase n=1 Tax=Cardiosporidium cionae TaxID=476202 RepID=A0ABQ7J450_9APIC|nr:hypothetical protein IE077_000529 [Cardiosporidium cionae]|eukprot:KAF8817864.1 hypothetical protein IE077_000529 [Cardiosporidium cionae]